MTGEAVFRAQKVLGALSAELNLPVGIARDGDDEVREQVVVLGGVRLHTERLFHERLDVARAGDRAETVNPLAVRGKEAGVGGEVAAVEVTAVVEQQRLNLGSLFGRREKDSRPLLLLTGRASRSTGGWSIRQ